MNAHVNASKGLIKWGLLFITVIIFCYSITKIQVHIDCLGCGQNPTIKTDILKNNLTANSTTTAVKEISVPASAIDHKVMCPKYILPELPPVPKLPPKEVLTGLDKDQLNVVLYQNVRSHQERVLVARKILYTSYEDYLKSCN